MAAHVISIGPAWRNKEEVDGNEEEEEGEQEEGRCLSSAQPDSRCSDDYHSSSHMHEEEEAEGGGEAVVPGFAVPVPVRGRVREVAIDDAVIDAAIVAVFAVAVADAGAGRGAAAAAAAIAGGGGPQLRTDVLRWTKLAVHLAQVHDESLLFQDLCGDVNLCMPPLHERRFTSDEFTASTLTGTFHVDTILSSLGSTTLGQELLMIFPVDEFIRPLVIGINDRLVAAHPHRLRDAHELLPYSVALATRHPTCRKSVFAAIYCLFLIGLLSVLVASRYHINVFSFLLFRTLWISSWVLYAIMLLYQGVCRHFVKKLSIPLHAANRMINVALHSQHRPRPFESSCWFFDGPLPPPPPALPLVVERNRYRDSQDRTLDGFYDDKLYGFHVELRRDGEVFPFAPHRERVTLRIRVAMRHTCVRCRAVQEQASAPTYATQKHCMRCGVVFHGDASYCLATPACTDHDSVAAAVAAAAAAARVPGHVPHDPGHRFCAQCGRLRR